MQHEQMGLDMHRPCSEVPAGGEADRKCGLQGFIADAGLDVADEQRAGRGLARRQIPDARGHAATALNMGEGVCAAGGMHAHTASSGSLATVRPQLQTPGRPKHIILGRAPPGMAPSHSRQLPRP